ncbi:MAG: HAMP domain-containing sensor histidine kinase [Actinomycetota bacterium]|nr:HAMP domain-containing sensor histidine kinase [Actinomycetota bacterium]
MRRSGRFGHAARVAGTAALVVGLVYLAVVAVIDEVAEVRLVHSTDLTLQTVLDQAATRPGPVGAQQVLKDIDDAPVLLWWVPTGGSPVAEVEGAPPLPVAAWARAGTVPFTVSAGGRILRVDTRRVAGGVVVAGISLAAVDHVHDVLVGIQLVVGPVLVVLTYAGALLVGVKAVAPVELARRRQLEFTADASHELRTPLSVIEAEVGLTLSSPRSPDAYRRSLELVRSESGRLRSIVDSLLWLARFDGAPPEPGAEQVDLRDVARTCVDRFAPVAAGRDQSLELEVTDAPVVVGAPREWLDRLAGVLVDNACRHAGIGGSVTVSTWSTGGRVGLVVEDSGPGIPPGERDRLFDRFHRVGDEPGGAGLGLAIADSVVRATGGRWHVGDSRLGGASMTVHWHRHGRPGIRHPAGVWHPPEE